MLLVVAGEECREQRPLELEPDVRGGCGTGPLHLPRQGQLALVALGGIRGIRG